MRGGTQLILIQCQPLLRSTDETDKSIINLLDVIIPFHIQLKELNMDENLKNTNNIMEHTARVFGVLLVSTVLTNICMG